LLGLNTEISDSVTICQGEKTNLSASGGNTYHWLPDLNINDPELSFVTVNPPSTTIYSVGISNNNLCVQTRTVLVNVVPGPVVNAGQDTTINIGDPVTLSASGEGVFKWISDENLSCKDCRVTNVLPFTRTCYQVELTGESGCKAMDEVCVEIINDFGVYIPNTFTPNNDGMNDVFEISFYGIKEIRLNIFDRWGVQLFSTDDLKNNWNGIYNGKACQVGTYVYKLQYEPYKGKSGERVGHVNLVR
jgi:gliding motility-associated-like protein